MSENNKTQEFLQKLAPCIERSDLDACVEEAALELGMEELTISIMQTYYV